LADQNIVTNITATANFSSLTAQLQAVTSQLLKLQTTTIGVNKNLTSQVGVMNRQFDETMRSTGQFSRHFVTLTSDVSKFGQNLDSGRMKLGQYFRTWQGHTQKTSSLVKDLAKQQVMLENAIIQPLGKNAQGLMQYNVMVQSGLDATKNKTALMRQELSIMNKVMNDGANQLINWGKNTQWAGRQLTVGLTVPLAAFGMAASKAFKQADEELVRLTKVYGGLTATSSADLLQVRKDVMAVSRELASGLGANFTETIGLAADIAATGKQGLDLIDSTRQTTRLAILGEVDRQEAMKATLAIQTAFGQNTMQLAESIDFLNAVENQTSTTLDDLVTAIPKAGPVVKALGGDVQDLALYLTAMREGGINASEGANALKSALASIINPTKVAKEMFTGFGIDLGGIVEKNAGNLTGTIMALKDSLDTLDPLSRARAIEQLFGKFQFARINALFENLGKQGSQTLQVLDLMKASTQDLASISARELTALTESASGKYRRALESVKADLAVVGEQFLKVGTFVLNAIDGIIKFIGNLPGPIKAVLGFVASLTAVAGPIIMLTGVLANFFGYIVKGIFALKNIGKSGEGFKLLTPELMAASNAAKTVEQSFYSDTKAAATFSDAVLTLASSFNRLKENAMSATIATSNTMSTVSGNPVVSMGGRIVDKNNPLVGEPYSRDMSHMSPTGSKTPEQRASETIFSTVPGPQPVNQRISNAPQTYMKTDLPKIPGVTSVNSVSTGVVAAEAAKWHSMTAAIAMQSQAEIALLKTEIAATGTVTASLSDSYQLLLPEMTEITSMAADETALIVKQLQAGKITVESARAKIFELNAVVETMMAETAQGIATAQARTINLTTVPLTSQSVVSAAGKSNMKELFHKTDTAATIDAIAKSLGVRTSGAGYSIQTTKPRKYNSGGYVYDPKKDGAVVPGSTSIKYDNTPAKLPLGGFVLNQQASMTNPDLVENAKQGYSNGGTIDAIVTPGETVVSPEIYAQNKEAYDVANKTKKTVSLMSTGGMLGGLVMSSKNSYGLENPQEIAAKKIRDKEILKRYIEMIKNPNYEDEIRMRSIMLDASELSDHMDPKKAIKIATENFDFAKNKSGGSMERFLEIRRRQLDELDEMLGGQQKIKLNSSAESQSTARSTALNRNLNKVRSLMLRDKSFASVKEIIESIPKTSGTNSAGVPYLRGSVRGHLIRRGDLSGSGQRGFFGNAVVLPADINSFMAMLQGKGLMPDLVHLNQKQAIESFEKMLLQAGLPKNASMETIYRALDSNNKFPTKKEMSANKPRATQAEKKLLEQFLLRLAMPRQRMVARGYVKGGPLPWVRGGVSKEMEAASKRSFAKYPNGQRSTVGEAPRLAKYPQPKSYYQQLANDDPLHGPLQIGSYWGSLHVRNRYVAPSIRYRNGQGYEKQSAAPAFEIGDAESRAKSALFAYMQGDYSRINDPAVQDYLSKLRTKFTGTLHRGVSHSGSLPPVIANLIQQGKWSELVGKEFIMRRSSWSKNPETAKGFMGKQHDKVLMTADVKNRNAVPASEIFPDLTFQTPQGPVKVNENEVYMGGKFRVVAASKNAIKVQAVIDGQRANGGPVLSGKSYLVGEKGPELFRPGQSGQITPMNNGGQIPKYNMGGVIKQLALMTGLSMGAGKLGSSVGGGAGSVITQLGNLLPFLLMGNMGVGKIRPVRSARPEGMEGPLREGGTFGKPSLRDPILGKTVNKLTGLSKEGSTSTKVIGKLGSTLGNALKIFSRANLILAGVTTALILGKKGWDEYYKRQKLNQATFGLTAESAKKAGLRFTDFGLKMKEAVQTSKDMVAANKFLYESMKDGGTPFQMSIAEVQKLRKEVKETFAEQVEAFDKSPSDKIPAAAIRMKEQLIAAGMSAEEATKKIYTMLTLSNDADQAFSATIGSAAFKKILDPQSAAVSSLSSFSGAVENEGNKEKALSLNTALMATETGINDLIAKRERLVAKNLDGKEKLLSFDEAEKTMLDQLNASADSRTKITQGTVDVLAETNPEVRKLINGSDTVVSVWQKIRLEAKGFSGDLSKLNAEQANAIFESFQAVGSTVEATNREGILKTQYTALGKLKDQITNYTKALKQQTVSQQISDRDRIASLNKQIDANNKLAEARKKALSASQQDADLGRQIEKTRLEMQNAQATGDTEKAQSLRIDLESLTTQQQTDSQIRAIDKATEAANKPLQDALDAMGKKQQDLADSAALAGESLDKIKEKYAKQEAAINKVNGAMTALYVNASAAGLTIEEYVKTVKGGQEAAGLVSATEEATGVKMPRYTGTERRGENGGPGETPRIAERRGENGGPGSVVAVTPQANALSILAKAGAGSAANDALANSIKGGASLKDIVDAIQNKEDSKKLKKISYAINQSGSYANKVGPGALSNAGISSAEQVLGKTFLDKDGVKWKISSLPTSYNNPDFGVTKAGFGAMNLNPKIPTIVGDRGPEMVFGGMVIPNMAKVPFASPRYDVKEAAKRFEPMQQRSSSASYVVNQNIYASDGMDIEALSNMVVKKAEVVIGQKAKVNVKMIGQGKNI
jgi:TP901 family phage tail tape measure protein